MPPRGFRAPLIAASVIHGGIAALVSTAVLPAAITDAFPGATPERSVAALWAIVAANLLLALWLSAIATGHLRTKTFSKLSWAIPPLFALLLLAPLIDAALAFWSHGQAMHTASIALFMCAFGSAVSAFLVFINRRLQNHDADGV